MQASNVASELRKLGSPALAKTQEWFYKTGPGEYGEGDKFLGIRVPVSRSVAKGFKDLPLAEIRELAMSEFQRGTILCVGDTGQPLQVIQGHKEARGAVQPLPGAS